MTKRPDTIDWLTLAAWLATVGIIAWVIFGGRAHAADWQACQDYATKFAELFKITVQRDLNPYFRDRAFSVCLNQDETPKIELKPVEGTAPAAAQPETTNQLPETTKPKLAAWQITCQRRYRSFDIATGTVIKRGSHTRTPCPVRKR